jgi:hypothetical protein
LVGWFATGTATWTSAHFQVAGQSVSVAQVLALGWQ